MKKIFAVLLCMTLLVSCAAAEQLRVFSYSIPRLISRQLTSNTSLKVRLTAEGEGSAPAGMDAQVWEKLLAALPALEVSGTYMLRKTNGNMQVTAQLKKNGEAFSALSLTGQGNDYLLETDLLPGISLAVPRQFSGLVQVLTAPEEDEWPSLWRMVASIEEAGDEYAAALETALEPHLAEINNWLKQYTDMQMNTDAAGQPVPVQTVSIPAEDLKAYTKEALAQLYADENLLALLREVVSEKDANVYLMGGMLPLYEAAIDAAALEGDVLICRQYDAQGVLSSEEITLPFVAGTGLKKLHLTSVSAQTETTRGVEMVFAAGESVQLTVRETKTDDGHSVYAGEIRLTNAQNESFAARYTLDVHMGEETYDASQKNKERRQTHEATLTLEPLVPGDFRKQQVQATVNLIAGASNTNAAHCNITLNWRDLESDTAFTLYAKSNTSTGLKVPEQDMGSAVRLENLSVQDLREWLADTAVYVQTQLAQLFNRSLTDVPAEN